jgi:hypothetical protein
MKKHNVTLRQLYTGEIFVNIEVMSNLSPDELESEISEITRDWRVARLSDEELVRTELIKGYVKGSFSKQDGEFDPADDVECSVEGSSSSNEESEE